MPEFWIQLENHAWDTCPNNIDRMTGLDIQHREGPAPMTNVTLASPSTGTVRNNVTMYRPLMRQDNGQPVIDEALILRRYKPPTKHDNSDAWTVPDDRKVNPWDLNEPDPTDSGTMGTIPGPVIECNVGDSVIVHFRNLDNRTKLQTQQICFPFPFGQICFPVTLPVPFPIEKRTHSLHPHGFVFAPSSDGAYPLSPPDPHQSIPPSEAAAWASVGVTGPFKQGDRVPPGGTFNYTWNTLGWHTTAGVWLYHDHSVCDMDNVQHGAIGIVVIHNPEDAANEVDIRIAGDPNNTPDPAFLPQGTLNASPVETICFPIPFPFPFGARVLPHDLAGLGQSPGGTQSTTMQGMVGMKPAVAAVRGVAPAAPMKKGGKAMTDPPQRVPEGKGEIGPPVPARTIQQGNLLLELDDKLQRVLRFCIRFYAQPPTKALYLQLFHTLGDAGTCINGRKYLGNTPTLIAGPRQGTQPGTRMRFGVVGMGSDFHTFHIHGHRWILPGPTGTNLNAIQNSAQNSPVSQFEDTRAFGPANSFVFTIDEDSGLPSFFRAEPSVDPEAGEPPVGEWHMHCHVLEHMMMGMMGSLLVVTGGTVANPLPAATLVCPDDVAGMTGMGGTGGTGGGPTTHEVDANKDAGNPTGYSFNPSSLTVKQGDTVVFKNASDQPHSIVWDTPGAPANTPVFNPSTPPTSVSVVMSNTGTFNYHCGIHGAQMNGTITVNP
jgi:plastocyanin/FtsP/CotA-like multicopper oxidase with cupredoxin domain